MNIFAIDPGYDRCGIAVIEKGSGQKHTLLFSGCVTTKKTDSFEARLNCIYTECDTVIQKYKPASVALERLFFTNNQRTAMRVAEVRGMLIQLATSHNLPVHEYTPSQIKVAVAGNGRASKSDIQRMLPLLITILHRPHHDDEYDAIAIGLTHLASMRGMH
jgi:crossover junction endodeoxyribonuclease RuvC